MRSLKAFDQYSPTKAQLTTCMSFYVFAPIQLSNVCSSSFLLRTNCLHNTIQDFTSERCTMCTFPIFTC